MNRLKKLVIGAGLLLTSWNTNAQLNNQALFATQKDTSKVQSLAFHFRTLGFFKNNEYFNNNIARGYTLFGYQFEPTLRYRISDEVTMDAGVYAQKDFGNPAFSEVIPVFRLKVQKNRTTLLFGTLEGRLAHGLIEPLYEFERGLIQTPENGLQFLWQGNRLKIDSWLDWQQMIYPGEDRQEKFFAGTSLNWQLYQQDMLRLSVPFQLTATHWGGQIDTSPLPALTFFNAALGLQLEKQYPGSPVSSWKLEQYYTLYLDNGDVATFYYLDGQGFYSNLTVNSRYLNLVLSYWNGAHYVSPTGGYLYQSVSHQNLEVDVDKTQSNRSLLFIRLLKDFEFSGGLKLGLRIQPVYDLNRKVFESYQGVYLSYDGGFSLWKKNK